MAPSTRPQTPQGPYWYENLGEDDFQRLCAAIIKHKYDKVRCYPVGQKDGGRDVKRTTADGDLVYQVKWSKNAIKDPVGWLTQAVNRERANIKRHIANGAKRYLLITSVSGTAAAQTDASGRGAGTIDKLDTALEAYRTEFGLDAMECWWRDDLDAEVVNAPTNILWRFQKMLAGAEALRFVLEASQAELSHHRLALVIRKLVSTQWSQDSKVKFKQVDLDHHDLEDLFIDVKASVTNAVGTSNIQRQPSGAVQYLMTSAQPFTLVRGEPGQGKSTLGQQLCQIFRSPFIPDDASGSLKRPAMRPETDRVPIRIDLRDYGSWLEGGDPFAETITSSAKAPKARSRGELEHFLVTAVSRWAVADDLDLGMINDLLYRYPMLIVLDGLDEVAQRDTRARVVKLIEQFVQRWRHGGVPPKLVVTTRPNVADLPEPSERLFELATLIKLDKELRSDYLRKWSAVRGIRGPDRRALMRTFDARTAEPHIAQLAENPMQLTILLYLLHMRGQSVPDRRTNLYDDYMRTFLDREAEKSTSVRDNRTNLEEVTAYLGWLLHASAEQHGGSGRLKTSDLRTEIFRYLDQAHKDTRLVDALFTDVTDRVWALSSKAQGTFEFDVQPVREYFAAKYLARYASADKAAILNALIRRPFWFNVSRFFAGFANPNEIGGLVDGLTEEVSSGTHPLQTRTAIWTLLADGVFADKTIAEERAVGLLVDDLSIRLMHAAMSAGELTPLPPSAASTTFARHLLSSAAAAPAHHVSTERVDIVQQLGLESPGLGEWWLEHARAAFSSPTETAWLALGESWNAGRLLTADDHQNLALSDDASIAAAIAAGVTPSAGSTLETRFHQAILRGSCSDVRSAETGFPADLVNALAPRQFLALAKPLDRRVFETNSGHCETLLIDLKRTHAFRRLKDRNPAFGKIQRAMNLARKAVNTVQPWSDCAQQLRHLYGPSWLATDIAVIGAAIDSNQRRDLGPMSPHCTAFGSTIHYGNLVNDVRVHRSDAAWWTAQRAGLEGFDLAAWIYALAAVAAPDVLNDTMTELRSAVDSLDDFLLGPVLRSSSRLGLSGISRRLPTSLVTQARQSAATTLLLMHHADDLSGSSNMAGLFSPDELAGMAHRGVAAWPALRVVGRELASSPSDQWLSVLRAFGPYAVGGVAQGPLPAKIAKQILGSPADFPAKWVTLADLCLSQSHVEPALLTDSAQWFE